MSSSRNVFSYYVMLRELEDINRHSLCREMFLFVYQLTNYDLRQYSKKMKEGRNISGSSSDVQDPLTRAGFVEEIEEALGNECGIVDPDLVTNAMISETDPQTFAVAWFEIYLDEEAEQSPEKVESYTDVSVFKFCEHFIFSYVLCMLIRVGCREG